MTFSVIIPVYNGYKVLPAAVASVYAQGVDFTLILVDDGSTDGSGELCDSFAQKDKRVQVIHQKNAYAGAARNAGLRVATGDYVCFLDADDCLTHGVLQQAAAYEGADIICSNRFCTVDWNTGKKTLQTGNFDNGLELLTLNTRLAAFSPYLAQSVYRLGFVRQSGVVFSERRAIGEDRDWTVRLIHRSRRTAVLSVPMYAYTVGRVGSVMHTVSVSLLPDSMRLMEELLSDLGGMAYAKDGDLEQKIANEYLRFAVCCGLVRKREKRNELLKSVNLSLLQRSSARPFLWLRHLFGLRFLFLLCNFTFLHDRTDQ